MNTTTSQVISEFVVEGKEAALPPPQNFLHPKP
jgi:hypothetical protein